MNVLHYLDALYVWVYRIIVYHYCRYVFRDQVSINEQSILRVFETMFLGVFLDDNLTWKPHISLLASKLSKSIGIIHKSRFFLSTQSLRTLYN